MVEMSTSALPIDIETVKGFLAPEEGQALREHAQACASLGPVLEIGSYCGKSTVYLGMGAQAGGGQVLAVDHHRGSEENQPDQMFHDPDLADGHGGIDTLPLFRKTIRDADLEDVVIPVATSAAHFARVWQQPLGMVFIDGGHTLDAALTDYRLFAPKVAPGGILAIHDVHPDPETGGRPPYEVYELALASGLFRALALIETLAILRRI
ncbi:MAG: class I SAM-dependent methyltransferase [Pyruvatibacter sp.]